MKNDDYIFIIMSKTTPTAIFLLSILASGSAFDFPDNVNFVTSLYNDSRCTEFRENLTLPYMCFDTSSVNGHPKCCHEILSDISTVTNASLETCYQTGGGTVRYSCDTTNFNKFTTQEIFSYIGLILLIINVVLILGCFCKYCLCNRRRSYDHV